MTQSDLCLVIILLNFIKVISPVGQLIKCNDIKPD